MKILNKTATNIFLRLVALAKENNGYVKLDNKKGVMPLIVEKVEQIEDYEIYSLAHYGTQNGDLMADPEMCFLLAQNDKDTIVMPYSFRNDYMGIDQIDLFIENGKIKGIRHKAVTKNVAFANTWLKNIQNQQLI
ncbi:DUF6908 domain-containing protein [Tenacibaculum jejuense]|uniref:DUF6908 domain-containing protein n=1 Tax=Tenacibaculum jejuense TaxID=584609 RepID=A0A238U7G1_9FLAO|nr:hypothetical protein [Tenacibaculum jejuense]SNR14424.1 conserved protein of unknown function [Tenacibaculum jejuense]